MVAVVVVVGKINCFTLHVEFFVEQGSINAYCKHAFTAIAPASEDSVMGHQSCMFFISLSVSSFIM